MGGDVSVMCRPLCVRAFRELREVMTVRRDEQALAATCQSHAHPLARRQVGMKPPESTTPDDTSRHLDSSSEVKMRDSRGRFRYVQGANSNAVTQFCVGIGSY